MRAESPLLQRREPRFEGRWPQRRERPRREPNASEVEKGASALVTSQVLRHWSCCQADRRADAGRRTTSQVEQVRFRAPLRSDGIAVTAFMRAQTALVVLVAAVGRDLHRERIALASTSTDNRGPSATPARGRRAARVTCSTLSAGPSRDHPDSPKRIARPSLLFVPQVISYVSGASTGSKYPRTSSAPAEPSPPSSAAPEISRRGSSWSRVGSRAAADPSGEDARGSVRGVVLISPAPVTRSTLSSPRVRAQHLRSHPADPGREAHTPALHRLGALATSRTITTG